MAKCDVCKREMDLTVSCKPVTLTLNGIEYMPIRFGSEPYWNKPENGEYKPEKDDRCLDCNVLYNGYHHVGCREEACPICGEAMLKDCRCGWE